MLELGKYAATIHWAWGITLSLLGFLVVLSWFQARRAKRKYDEMEARRRGARKQATGAGATGEGAK